LRVIRLQQTLASSKDGDETWRMFEAAQRATAPQDDDGSAAGVQSIRIDKLIVDSNPASSASSKTIKPVAAIAPPPFGTMRR